MMIVRCAKRWAMLATLALSLCTLAPAAVEKGKNPYPAEWFWGEPEQRAQQDAIIGTKLPELEVSEWINGELKPHHLKGKIVVIDLWATWCGPCIAAIPKNNEMMEKYKDQDVLIVGICGSPKGQEKMAEVVTVSGAKYPNARDHAGKMAESLRLMWWPTYVVADRDGIIRAVGLQSGNVDKVVEAILAEEEGAKSEAPKKGVFEMERDVPKQESSSGKKEEDTKSDKKSE